MSMLRQWATGDNTMATPGGYDNEVPVTEPTTDAYVAEKARQYTAAARRNLGGAKNNTGVKWGWYNIAKMFRLRKIAKRDGKYNKTNWEA